MSAEVLPFPTPPAASEQAGEFQPVSVGDIVLMLLNPTMDLWIAWPVAAVDRDGVVTMVHDRHGDLYCANRLNAGTEVYGFRASDHLTEPFAGMKWRTWIGVGSALLDFAEIGERRCPSA